MQLMANTMRAQAGVSDTVQTSTTAAFVLSGTPANAAPFDTLTLRDKYYASEADILLATRRALYDEIVMFKPVIGGREYQALVNFVDMLRKVSGRMGLIPIL